MRKKIVYYVNARGGNPVRAFLDSLPAEEKNKCFEYLEYLKEMGEQVRCPVGDYLGGKLYELRPKQNRIIYFFMLRDYAVLLHAFRKKTDAIPEKEMRIALARMQETIRSYDQGRLEWGE